MKQKTKLTKKERLKYILISIACIIILSIFLCFRINALTKINNASLNIIPKEIPNITMPYEMKATGYEIFETESRDLKITFPNNWNKEHGTKIFEALSGGENKLEAKIIFLIYKITGLSGNLSFLLVEETEKTDINDILHNIIGVDLVIKNEVQNKENDDLEVKKEKGVNSNDLKNALIVEQAENSLLLEVFSKEKEGVLTHAYDKILVGENKSYIVSLFTFENFWESEKTEFLEIINSIVFNK